MVDRARLRSWLESTKTRGMALGLEQTASALASLDCQSIGHRTLHVAGSNGKGTLCAVLSAALSQENIPHLMFSSPHLIDVEERIRLNGIPVSSEQFDIALSRVYAATEANNISITFFEATFLIAMAVADAHAIDVLILETGLGGRLDATRVAKADVCAVTSLSLEHTDILGDTLTQIAREKAAIARPGSPLIVRRPPQLEVVMAVEEEARKAGSKVLDEPKLPAEVTWVDVANATTYVEEATLIARAVWPHLVTDIHQVMPALVELQWPARMHYLTSSSHQGITFLLEGAHNSSGMTRACDELRGIMPAQWVLIFGCSPQSNLEEMLAPLLKMCAKEPPQAILLTEPQGGRYPGVARSVLKGHFEPLTTTSISLHATPKDAVEACRNLLPSGGLVLSIGSLYLQGNVIETLDLDRDEVMKICAKQSKNTTQ